MPPASQNTTSASMSKQRQRGEEDRPAQILRLAQPVGFDAGVEGGDSRAARAGRPGASVFTASSPSGGP